MVLLNSPILRRGIFGACDSVLRVGMDSQSRTEESYHAEEQGHNEQISAGHPNSRVRAEVQCTSSN
jgi:hypothetical protein